jgi:hypothetical protein
MASMHHCIDAGWRSQHTVPLLRKLIQTDMSIEQCMLSTMLSPHADGPETLRGCDPVTESATNPYSPHEAPS